MKILFVVPEIRLDSLPYHIPFWAGILGAIADKKGADVGILDLNALRMNYDGNLVPKEVIRKEVSSEDWDIIGIGGLTTAYSRIKEIAPLIKNSSPKSLFIGGGGWCSYNPDEILKLIPQIDMLVIGEGEETFAELCDQVLMNNKNFEDVNGLCIRDGDSCKFTNPRALISNLDSIPYPAYDLMELDIYFDNSSIPLSVESYNSKRRASVVWERGCPRGCTFCSHNGMSRIDLQNIYGSGNREEGEKLVRISDKENNTFQLPARWPSPEYAVNNVKLLLERYNVDFITILDENMTSNIKWTKEFCDLYIKEGLNNLVKWGTLGDAPSVATQPHIIKLMKEAGCSYISFGFESASDKVLNQDIKKGQTKNHLQKTINALHNNNMTPITTFMIGNPHEDINDIMETLTFWVKNDLEVEPFICTPYIGSPIYYDNKDFILSQYDSRIKLATDKQELFDKDKIQEWRLEALDKFMKECGDATNYTATVSKKFSISDLISIKEFMYKQDIRRLLQMAHQRYEQTKLNQWKHSEKWDEFCDICKSKEILLKQI